MVAYGGTSLGDGWAATRGSHPSAFINNKAPFSEVSPFQRGLFFVKGTRRRMNVVAILIALFLPWGIFVLVNSVLSFAVHYKQPYVAYLLCGLAAGVCALALYYASRACFKKFVEPTYQPSWYMFIAITSIAAFILAVTSGEYNFVTNMQPYYNYLNLARYQDIDANAYLGSQIMDAGRINFKKGTALDLGRSMGFKNKDIYCVAPIVTAGSTDTPLSVDFWAVGKNCCSGVTADFHCSGFSDPKATGVIRMMQNEERPFYRLAVQQAEATYKMTASHPLFFTWVTNADEAVDHFAHKGYAFFALAIGAHLTLQVFLTAAASLAFAKLVHAPASV